MAGYIGSKAVSLSTTAADVTGDAEIGGDLTVDTNTLYVDSTNNRVGVGTSSPDSLLDVATTGEVTGTIRSTSTSGARQATLRLNVASTGGDDPAGKVQFTYGTGYSVAGSIEMSHTNPNMKFFTGTTERMRITSDGTLEVNGSIMSKDDSSSPSGTEGGELILRAGSDSNQTKRVVLDNYDNTFRLVGQADDDGSSGYVIFQIPNGFSLYSNTSSGTANLGVASSGELYRSTSSRRYKNTINDASHGLTELLNLRPVTYKGNSSGDTVFGGLIAEEVHEAGLTEFVDYLEDENGDKILDGEGNPQPDAIHYANMVSLCIKAIQEQQATIEALKTRLDALEAN